MDSCRTAGSTSPIDVLATLDIVLASLHDDAKQKCANADAPLHAAMRHPLVSIITHPANRTWAAARLSTDFDAVYAAAAETGDGAGRSTAPVTSRP